MSETPLAARLKVLIAENGPMTVADYMAHCLGDPEHGYYMTRDPLGAAGDFTTAPEISQMFGEILGAWLVHAWKLAGSPAPVRIVELGPGRGTLMADILRVVRRAPDLLSAATVHLVETSPTLRARQEIALADAGARVLWHRDFAKIPAGAMLLFANEFFDALPFRQFVRAEGEWRERVVGLGPDGELCFGVGPGRLAVALEGPAGAILEVSPQRNGLMEAIANRVVRDGAAALIVDYGHSRTAVGDTFQALRNHVVVNPLSEPGMADLTSHVDFAKLSRAARVAGAVPHGPLTQGEFLLALGIAERANRLAAGKDEPVAAAIRTALERLTAPDQMGDLFKVLAVTRPGFAPPPFGSAV